MSRGAAAIRPRSIQVPDRIISASRATCSVASSSLFFAAAFSSRIVGRWGGRSGDATAGSAELSGAEHAESFSRARSSAMSCNPRFTSELPPDCRSPARRYSTNPFAALRSIANPGARNITSRMPPRPSFRHSQSNKVGLPSPLILLTAGLSGRYSTSIGTGSLMSVNSSFNRPDLILVCWVNSRAVAQDGMCTLRHGTSAVPPSPLSTSSHVSTTNPGTVWPLRINARSSNGLPTRECQNQNIPSSNKTPKNAELATSLSAGSGCQFRQIHPRRNQTPSGTNIR